MDWNERAVSVDLYSKCFETKQVSSIQVVVRKQTQLARFDRSTFELPCAAKISICLALWLSHIMQRADCLLC